LALGYPDDIKNAQRLADEWREKLFVAAVQRIEYVRGASPMLDVGSLRDKMEISDAMLYIETWHLREDIRSLDSSVKQVHAASTRLNESSHHLELLTRWLVGLTGVLTAFTIALVLISGWRLL